MTKVENAPGKVSQGEKDDEESDGYESVDHDVSKSTHGSPPSTQQIDL